MTIDEIIEVLEWTTSIGLERSLAAGHAEPAPSMLQMKHFDEIVAKLRSMEARLQAADELAFSMEHRSLLDQQYALAAYRNAGDVR